MQQATTATEQPTDGANAPRYDLRQIDVDPNFWYPVAWSRKVRPGKAFAARFAGHPIALIRPEYGPVYALEDRCAHRQVPLSKGVVDDKGCVKCCYHGWAFDQQGKCVTVPYLNKEGVGRPVKAYPCREKSGLIFIFPGDPDLADKVPVPDIAQVGNPEYKTRQFSPRLKCHYTFMHENLMDMNHQFLHRRQMGSITARFLGQDKGDNFMEARYSFARKGGNQPLAEALIFGKHHDDGREQPVEEVVSIRTTYPYQTLQIHDKDGDLIMDLWACYLPLGETQQVTQAFGLLSVKKPKWTFLLDVAWPVLGLFTHRIFEEDREIVEMEQNAWRELGGDHNVEVFPVVKSLRDLLARSGVPNRYAQPIK